MVMVDNVSQYLTRSFIHTASSYVISTQAGRRRRSRDRRRRRRRSRDRRRRRSRGRRRELP